MNNYNKHNILDKIVRFAMIFTLIGAITSPPLASLAEILIVLMLLSSKTLHQLLLKSWQQPMVKAALILYAIICIGILYSKAPLQDSLNTWWSWRKLLLLPIALAIFNTPIWKRCLLNTIISFTSIIACISFILWTINYVPPISASVEGGAGILLRDRVVQSMAFSAGAFSAILLAVYTAKTRMKLMLIASSILLMANILLVTPARSGYLALIIYITVLVGVYASWKNWSIFKILRLSGIATAFMIMMMLLVPASQQRIFSGLYEVQNYSHTDQAAGTMGLRLAIWENVPPLIWASPVFGHGTGAYRTVYSQRIAGLPYLALTPTHDPHNQYLKMAVEHGIVGLMAFILLLVMAFFQIASSSLYRILGLGVMAAWCATSFATSHFSTFPEGTFIFVWLGVMLAQEVKL